jgi:hypothetical protein
VAEVRRDCLDDRLSVFLHKARELLQVGAALGEARHGVRKVGQALALQRVAQDRRNSALGGM